MRPFLGNAFARKRGQLFSGRTEVVIRLPLGVSTSTKLSLKEVFYPVLVYDTFLEKVASRAQVILKLN